MALRSRLPPLRSGPVGRPRSPAGRQPVALAAHRPPPAILARGGGKERGRPALRVGGDAPRPSAGGERRGAAGRRSAELTPPAAAADNARCPRSGTAARHVGRDLFTSSGGAAATQRRARRAPPSAPPGAVPIGCRRPGTALPPPPAASRPRASQGGRGEGDARPFPRTYNAAVQARAGRDGRGACSAAAVSGRAARRDGVAALWREAERLTALSVPGRAVRVRGVWCGPAAKGCGGRGDGHSCLSRFVPSEPKLTGRAPCLCWPVLLRAGSARGAGGGPRAYRGARSLHGAVGGLVEASLKGAAIQT